MKINYFQKGFNYSQDGPGNRLVIHLQGCNIKCPWCANPEGMAVRPPLMQLEEKLPAYICPNGAILEDGALDRSVCRTCGIKASTPTDYTKTPCTTAFRNRMLVCQMKSVETADLAKEILSCVPMFWDGGGVTFTGGEMGLQKDAVIEVCEMLEAHSDASKNAENGVASVDKKTKDGQNRIHVAVETNLTVPGIAKVVPHLSYFIADYKHYDKEKLHEVTGANLEMIHRNLEEVLEQTNRFDIPVLLRIPLVHGFNDSEEDAKAFAEVFAALKEKTSDFSVELLSYHEYGKVKWEQCGMEYTMKDAHVTGATVKMFEETFGARGIRTVRT